MNQLLSIPAQKASITMSSREIAELCEKEHRHVLRDIRAYVGAIIQMERGINVKSLDWSEKEGVELFGHTPIGGVICRYEVNPVERIEMATYKPILLEKGAVKIFEAYLQGKLPMKADWNGKYYHSKVAV